MKIKFVEWGTANNFGSHIEIHKDLVNYPDLYYPILEHEIGHDNSILSIKDFMHDFNRIPNLNYKEMYKFMITRPKTWVQLLPFYYSSDKKQLVYDINLIIIYSLMFIVIGGNIILWKMIIG